MARTAAGMGNWKSIVSSSDGLKLAAAPSGLRHLKIFLFLLIVLLILLKLHKGYIWTSTDAGLTWLQRTSSGSRDWCSIVSSSDGNKLAAGECAGRAT